MVTTTTYGTWGNLINSHSLGAGNDVVDYLSGGDSEWLDRLQAQGIIDEIEAAYKAAVNAALPDDIALVGDEFIGPYPASDGVEDVIFEAVESVDLDKIVQDHNPDLPEGTT